MKKVLFLCVGNSCRSQMAEGFARKYGCDVMEPYSAGTSPAPIVQPLTKKVMEAKNIQIDDQFPKSIGRVEIGQLDLIVNMSGGELPIPTRAEVREWMVEDPVSKTEEVYIAVRDQIERLVMQLILELRREVRKAHAQAIGQSRPPATPEPPALPTTGQPRFNRPPRTEPRA